MESAAPQQKRSRTLAGPVQLTGAGAGITFQRGTADASPLQYGNSQHQQASLCPARYRTQ